MNYIIRNFKRPPYLHEVEAVWSPSAVVLQALHQVLPVFHPAAAHHLRHLHSHLLVAPIQLVDVRVVASLLALVGVLWPGGGKGRKYHFNGRGVFFIAIFIVLRFCMGSRVAQ